ncbi:MAG: zinc-ribbon domain-containing protein [Muribaculaceae bacterium]|nr:zinc-ribbon domain-containing protein [Muribaculaceae bacterium]
MASSALVCPNCHNELKPGMKFCVHCGTKLASEPVSTPPPQRS